LAGISGPELDDLYRGGTVTAIHRGVGAGTATFAPGRGVGLLLARITARAAWQGKVIDDDGATS
jgi:hypothetical protein